MNLPALALSGLALFLLACGAAGLAAMLKGCLLLRRLKGRRIDQTDILLKSPLVPPVSILTVPDGASPKARAFVRRLLSLHYSRHEVVVVLDGPDKAELAIWVAEFRLGHSARRSLGSLPGPPIIAIYESCDPLRLVVVHQEQGGLESALNNALNTSEHPVIGLVDPVSEFAPTLLLRMIQPMLEQPDSTLAVCGIGPAPAMPGRVARLAGIEFLRMYLARCAAFAASGRALPVPGAATLVLRDAIVAGGGFRSTTLELILHLQGRARQNKGNSRVAFVPDPGTYLPLPTTLDALRRSIYRDQAELRDAIGGTGRIAGGMRAAGRVLPSLLVERFLKPLSETAAYALTAVAYLAGWIDGMLASAVLLAAAGTGMLLSAAAVVLWDLSWAEGSDPKLLISLFATSIPENLGYRQLRNLWLIAGFLAHPRKTAQFSGEAHTRAATAK